jgi:hypothetical protein
MNNIVFNAKFTFFNSLTRALVSITLIFIIEKLNILDTEGKEPH